MDSMFCGHKKVRLKLVIGVHCILIVCHRSEILDFVLFVVYALCHRLEDLRLGV